MIGSDLFGLFSGRKLFQKKRICLRTQQIKKKSFIKIPGKIITNFFLKFKKTYFWPISPILGWGQKKFLPKNWAVMHNFIRVYSTMPKFREI